LTIGKLGEVFEGLQKDDIDKSQKIDGNERA
jgi:hypothetical protein